MCLPVMLLYYKKLDHTNSFTYNKHCCLHFPPNVASMPLIYEHQLSSISGQSQESLTLHHS